MAKGFPTLAWALAQAAALQEQLLPQILHSLSSCREYPLCCREGCLFQSAAPPVLLLLQPSSGSLLLLIPPHLPSSLPATFGPLCNLFSPSAPSLAEEGHKGGQKVLPYLSEKLPTFLNSGVANFYFMTGHSKHRSWCGQTWLGNVTIRGWKSWNQGIRSDPFRDRSNAI